MQTDVITSHVTIIKKAILNSGSFLRHFDPRKKPEEIKPKQGKCLEAKALFIRK